jgi:hypothetical protein
VECSSVVIQEEENAYTAGQTEPIEFPDNANELHDEIHDTKEMKNSSSRMNNKREVPDEAR